MNGARETASYEDLMVQLKSRVQEHQPRKIAHRFRIWQGRSVWLTEFYNASSEKIRIAYFCPWLRS